MTTASSGGKSPRATSGSYQRRGPIHVSGEARSLQTGSVRMRWPSISIKTLEPRGAQSVRRERAELFRIDAHGGERGGWARVRARVEKAGERAPRVVRKGLGVFEVAVLPMRRSLHARQARAWRAAAE